VVCDDRQHEHNYNYHSLMNMFDHYYQHTVDVNGDGCATVEEELALFHEQDGNGRHKVVHQ
jgi:hypothetical protein